MVFLDESGTHASMTRRYGRAPRGVRVSERVPRNRGSNTTVLGAIGLRGVVATMTVEGGVDTSVFDAYVRRLLAPRLREGDILVLDNLGAHRASQVEQAVGARGASVLWLPPYSPDFNPVEQLWSKIKTYLRGAKARTRADLDRALTAALRLVTRADIRGWFARCGYSVARK